MESPPSGWYPDPYRVPGLLRWWDGSAWTHHTHASGGTDATDGTGPGAPAAAWQTSVQPAVQPPVLPAPVLPTTVQPAVQATTAQPPVQATTAQPPVQATTVQPAVQAAARGSDSNGTAVLFLGDDAWGTPGTPGPGEGDRYGYYRAQQRRRMWLMGGLAAGTAVVLALIGLVISNLGGSRPILAVGKTPKPTAASAPPSPTASPTPSATPLADGVSGLSYTQLPAPWQPGGCPSALNQGFTWSAGESAVAAQVNGGQTTWYGEACSAPLPQQYGYNGVADLENVTTVLVNQFTGAYYNGLPHGFLQQVSEPVTISGHAGWKIQYQISYQNAQNEGLPFTDEEGAVVVADLGTGAAPAVFFASIPGNLGGGGDLNSLVSSLQASAPTQPGGGGSPGDGSPAPGSPGGGGSPGDGGGDGGGGGGH